MGSCESCCTGVCCRKMGSKVGARGVLIRMGGIHVSRGGMDVGLDLDVKYSSSSALGVLTCSTAAYLGLACSPWRAVGMSAM